MFRPFTMAIFRLRLKTLSQQLYLCLLYTANTSITSHCKRPKHVVDLYAVNFIYIYITSNKVVLD